METPPDAEETPSQRQARLRRERRQAKIAAEGPERLAKITGIAGRRGPGPSPAALAAARAASAASSSSSSTDQGTTGAGAAAAAAEGEAGAGMEAEMRTALAAAGLDAGLGGRADDPMRLLQQLLGADGPEAQGSSPLASGIARLLNALPEGQEGVKKDAVQEKPPTVSAASWRILHAVVSLLLALYVTLSYEGGFDGTKRARVANEGALAGEDIGKRLFFWFATLEVVLQSSRYFMERGQQQRSGILGTLASFVPEPFAGYLRVISRYSVIFSTLAQDALVIIFVLGLMVWWNGFADAVESR
jgi:hypothetical protein